MQCHLTEGNEQSQHTPDDAVRKDDVEKQVDIIMPCQPAFYRRLSKRAALSHHNPEVHAEPGPPARLDEMWPEW